MSLSKEASRRIWEIVLAEALEENCRTELEEFDAPEEEQYEFSKEFEKNIKKITRSIGRKETVKISLKAAVRIAAVTMSALGIVFCCLLSDPKVYAAVNDVFKGIFDIKDEYNFRNNKADYDDLNLYRQLGYVPEGYELRSILFTNVRTSLTYENDSGEIIIFEYTEIAGSQLLIDNEDQDFIIIEIDGQKYYFYESDNNNNDNKIMWSDNNCFYVISAPLDKDLIVEIAENTK